DAAQVLASILAVEKRGGRCVHGDNSIIYVRCANDEPLRTTMLDCIGLVLASRSIRWAARLVAGVRHARVAAAPTSMNGQTTSAGQNWWRWMCAALGPCPTSRAATLFSGRR